MEKQIKLNNEQTYYYITEDGRLHNRKTNNWYKGSISGGYHKYDLVWNHKKYPCFAHRLVAEYFLNNPNNLPVVNHKDGNKLNNNVNNLEWVSYSENSIHAYSNNLKEKTNAINSRQRYSIDLPGEIWIRFKDSSFLISNKGRIRNEKTNNLLKGKIGSKGYVEWCLSVNGIKHSYLAHRLVYELFGEELKPGYQINHIDGNKQNNNIENLEQVLPSENVLHSYYKIKNDRIKKVGKYDLNGELIEIYLSCADAARKNEGCYSNLISNVCNGKKHSHKGFIWKYIE